jgi:hypothetical protein
MPVAQNSLLKRRSSLYTLFCSLTSFAKECPHVKLGQEYGSRRILNLECNEDEGEKFTHCCICLPCVQTGVLSAILVQQVESVQLPALSKPSNPL